MDWEAALRQRLKDDALVDSLAPGGIEWRQRPANGSGSSIVLVSVSDPQLQDLKGFVSRQNSRVQVDCRASTRAAAVALRKAAIAALAPGGDFHGVRFGRAMFDPARDLGEPTETGFVHRDSFDVTVMHD